jgi:two-component system nitrogen regulation sensor histidine kinase NtrY
MTRLATAWARYRRENRFLLIGFVVLMVLSAGAFYLLQRTQEASPEELTNRLLLFILWYLDISLILILTFILVRSLVRLLAERRRGLLGSRFRTKLVLTYVVLTFVPVIFIFLIATNILQRSIDQWFSSPVEETLRTGTAVTVQVRELVEQRLLRQAAIAAEQLADDASPNRLPRLRTTMGVDLLAVFEGPRLLQSVSDPRRISSTPPPLRWEQLPESGVRSRRWNAGLLVRAWAPVNDGDTIVVVGDMLPRELLFDLESTTGAYAAFQEMKLQRGTVTATTILVFLAVTLLLLFATVWVGLFLSRRFTEPLLAVAAATQRVAEGNELEEVAVPASDEVAVLVHSFNAMVRRVRATEAEILASNQELATLLATVPTGVLTVDAEHSGFRPNPAAARILGMPQWAGTWLATDELHHPQLESLRAALQPGDAETSRREIDMEIDGVVKHLDMTLTPLPGGGSVVTLDDLTQLVQAQRQAAWSEVAQRIAHEIKNPLTPIRLAAERMQRWADRLDDEVRDIVSSGCEAIIAQVTGLKELVDAFRLYARMPKVVPKTTSLNQIVREMGSLYSGLRDGLTVQISVPSEEVMAVVDPVLIRQALVNLLDNSVHAVDGTGKIMVSVRHDDDHAVLEVADSGTGLPSEDTETLIQPFYSTKGRGSGMGLALVHRIVAEHGGVLEFENRRPTGALVRITVPRGVAELPSPAANTSAAESVDEPTV